MAMSVLVVITVALTIWSLVFIMARRHETTRLAFITTRTVEETISCPVAFIDQHDKLLAPADGILVPLVEEGARVAKGDRVAMIVPFHLEEDVERFLSANDAYHARRIVLAGLSNSVEDVLPRTRSDSIMREAIFSLSRAPIMGDLSALKNAIEHMNLALKAYRGESLRETGYDAELTERLRERNQLLEQLEVSAGTDGILTALTPGTVSFIISFPSDVMDEDSWRNIADPRAEIERLANQSHQPIDSRQGRVSSNMPVVCISNVAVNTMVTVIPHDPDEETRLKRGMTVNLIVSPDLRLDRCRVSRVVRGDEDDRIFLKAPSDVEISTSLIAVTDAQMIVKVSTGSAVPVRSLIGLSDDMTTAKLKKVKRGVTKTIEVDVLACDGTYAIVQGSEYEEPLREADLYVVNPWTIDDGQLID